MAANVLRYEGVPGLMEVGEAPVVRVVIGFYCNVDTHTHTHTCTHTHTLTLTV